MIVYYKYILFLVLLQQDSSFKDIQRSYRSVQEAYSRYDTAMLRNLMTHHIRTNEMSVFLQVFKEEETVELWAKNKKDSVYVLLESFKAVRMGRRADKIKAREGMDIPEGLYNINRLIPSEINLEIPINAPNLIDEGILGNPGRKGRTAVGGVNMDNIRLTNEGMQALYIYLVEAFNNGNKYIPIHIFPFRMTAETMKLKQTQYKDSPGLLRFWGNLEPAYSQFQQTQKIPRWTYGRGGYFFTHRSN